MVLLLTLHFKLAEEGMGVMELGGKDGLPFQNLPLHFERPLLIKFINLADLRLDVAELGLGWVMAKVVPFLELAFGVGEVTVEADKFFGHMVLRALGKITVVMMMGHACICAK